MYEIIVVVSVEEIGEGAYNETKFSILLNLKEDALLCTYNLLDFYIMIFK